MVCLFVSQVFEVSIQLFLQSFNEEARRQFLVKKAQHRMLLAAQWQGVEAITASYVPTEKRVHVAPSHTNALHIAGLVI